MNISNSKKKLAKIISENGGWPRNADWAAQCKFDSTVSFYYGMAPYIEKGDDAWYGDYLGAEHDIDVEKVLPNWHQTTLARDEYFHLYPAPDADGWIEWKGGECPVERGSLVDVRHRNKEEYIGVPALGRWNYAWFRSGINPDDIIAYRLHKAEAAAKPEHIATAPEPTIEQLAADYRAKLAIARQAQEEADSHRCGAEAALSRLENACLELGLKIKPASGRAIADMTPKLNITDWRDLRPGDVVFMYGDYWDSGVEYTVKINDGSEDAPVNVNGYWAFIGESSFKFIRRP